MVEWRLVRERARAYRRNLANTWSLFKESKIGVVGVGIMIAFVVLAVLAPVLPLRDPIFWRAPSEDVIDLPTYWEADMASVFFGGTGAPVTNQIAYRAPPRFTDLRTDRIYAASGRNLLAISPSAGTPGWNAPFVVDSNITAGPIGVNWGSKQNPTYMDFAVYVGTESGRLYALNDSATSPTGITGTPGGADVVVRDLGHRITSIAVWSEVTDDPNATSTPGRHARERVYVGTADGELFAFSAARLEIVWQQTLQPGVAVRMAGYPLNPPTNPSYSPALTEQGDIISVNGGRWYAFYTSDGSFAWPQFFDVGTPWTSAPVVALPSTLADGSFQELVYAATDDGWLFARSARTGDLYPAWRDSEASQVHPSGERAVPVMETVTERDPGPLHSPWAEGKTVYVTSQSGILYAIARDPIGDTPAGSVRWRFTEPVLRERGFRFTANPIVAPLQPIIYASGVITQGTDDPSDDQGIVYSVETDGALFWRRDFNASVLAPPSIWTTTSGTQLVPSLWVGTTQGWVISLASTGRYLAPLPPGTYPSGNQYLWGTDDQGRDILSQFIWGSRIALVVGFASALLSVGIGTVVGLVAGYVGRKTDVILMRFTDVILVLPTLPLLIILSAVLGASIGNVILVIALLAWPATARVIRAEVLSLKERPYIQSAKVTGASNSRIMFRHLTPNVMPLVFLYMTFAVSGAILFEAALSFLGLGDINTPSWGTMLSTIQQSDILGAWWWLLPPGLGITLLSLAFFLVGRAFEQIINPRLRTR